MFRKKKKTEDDEDYSSSKDLPISPSRSAMKDMMHKKTAKKKPFFMKKK